jgi:hypothetical protein
MSITKLREQYLELLGRYATLRDEYRRAEQGFDMADSPVVRKNLDDMAMKLVRAWAAMHTARIQLKIEEERHERERQQRLEGIDG